MELNTSQQIAKKNLLDFKNILDRLGIVFWLDGGTLLGAYRDHNFCANDEDDVDLCCWDNWMVLADELIARAAEKGFEVKRRWELEIAFKRDGYKIDLFFNKKNGKEAYTYLYRPGTFNIDKFVVIPAHFYEELELIEFHGALFNRPRNIEEYLTLKYGDWRTPVNRRDYSCYNAENNKLVREKYDIQ
ncbi:MAG: hypothetical protein NTZ18_03775 [Candidatus Komeilibacteria bacterium]|nr:hypothetical protein [Candidatus Komeilibacteria bacterium]